MQSKMPRLKKDPYSCCRCGYFTDHKASMRKHLYKLDRPCPGSRNNIELSDEVKIYILDNRIYHVPKVQSDTQIINNNYTINNFIANMDMCEKLTKYITYKGIPHIGYDKVIENRTDCNLHVLILDSEIPVEENGLHCHDIYALLDSITKTCDNDLHESVEVSVLYDNKTNKLKLYKDCTWDTETINIGIKALILTLQEKYFDRYEIYLLHILTNPSTHFQQRAIARNFLKEYYKFIGIFTIKPFIRNKTDAEIIGGKSTQYTVEEEYMKEYSHMITTTTSTDVDRVHKDILDIIKSNTKHNINELNKNIMDLLKMDNAFKTSILHSYSNR
jgi:hypothetical protein